jgi:hypothetical protein
VLQVFLLGLTDARPFLTVFFETPSSSAMALRLNLSARNWSALCAIPRYSGITASNKIAWKSISPAVRILCERVRTRGKKYRVVNRSTFARPEEKRSQAGSPNSLIFLVAGEGFEPSTFGL